MSDTPAHRAPVAERHVPHVRHRVRDQGPLPRDIRGALDRTLSGERPDLQISIALAYVGELVQPVYVDENLRRSQPHVQQRSEALAPRQNLSDLAVLA